jgi:xanthine dehydrogenase accessory factor
MSSDIYAKAAELVAEGQSFAVATVVRVEGSSSAQRGSKAIVDEQGRLALGWVGGGCAESTIRHEALRSIRRGQPSLITLDMTEEILGVGMPCGGKMDVYIEPVLPKPELLIAGHGRIAESLATLGHLLGFRVTVNDPGAEQAAFPQAEQLIAKDFDLSQTTFGPSTYVVIATQHKNDHLWLKKALNSQAAYVALIASQHRATLVLDYLAADGIRPDQIARIFTPAGLDLGATTPEEIALSIMSQIVALRRGGKVGRIRLHESQLSHPRPHRQKSDQPEGRDKVISQCDAPGAR